MSIESLKSQIPDYAKDLRLNLTALATDTTLTPQQRAGCFVASALASRNAAVTNAIIAEFTPALPAPALDAAKSAAAIMAMTNVYYRFVHLAGGDYGTMPARLRMNVLGRPGVEKVDFELWSLVVSAVNGCGTCMQAQERAVRQAGLSREQVQTAIRIASIVHAIAATLDGEAAIADGGHAIAV